MTNAAKIRPSGAFALPGVVVGAAAELQMSEGDIVRGPGHADKFPARFGKLLDFLSAQDYQFIRVDDLLEPNSRPSAREAAIAK